MSRTLVEKREYEGRGVIEIHVDEDAENPRQAFCEPGTLTSLKKKHHLCDDHVRGFWQFVENRAQEVYPKFPDFVDHWGEVDDEKLAQHALKILEKHFDYLGVAFTRDSVNHGRLDVSDDAVIWARKGEEGPDMLRSSIEAMSNWTSGEVFGFMVKAENPLTGEFEDLDGCWGYYGHGEIPRMYSEGLESLPQNDDQRIFDLAEAT